jgi:hypothetical protein
MKKIIVPIIIVFVVGGALILRPLTPKPQIKLFAMSEYTVTFKTIDGEIIAEVETVNGYVPTEQIPNPPVIDKRPFLRWTNVQGFSLDGNITANITFLPLYSYDPNFGIDEPVTEIPSTDNEEVKPYTKTSWLFMNYILDENAVITGAVLAVVVVIILLFIIRRILK